MAFAYDGQIEYNVYGYRFNNGDEQVFLRKADASLNQALTAKSDPEKKKYLQDSMRYYFLVTKINSSSINAQIGLGKIYDEMNLDKLSLEHFYKAYNINKDNPELNLSFGDYYFKRKYYTQAVKHYQKAYQLGYYKNFFLNYKMGLIYEKLGDLDKSRSFYANALRLDSKNKELKKKIHLLDDLNYRDSQYYLFVK